MPRRALYHAGMKAFLVFLTLLCLTSVVMFLLLLPIYLGGVAGLTLYYGVEHAGYYLHPSIVISQYARLTGMMLRDGAFDAVRGLALFTPPVVGLFVNILMVYVIRRIFKTLFAGAVVFAVPAPPKERRRKKRSYKEEAGIAKEIIDAEYNVIEKK